MVFVRRTLGRLSFRGVAFALVLSSGAGCGGAASAPPTADPMPNAPPPPSRPAVAQPPQEVLAPARPSTDPSPAVDPAPPSTTPDPTDAFEPQLEPGQCDDDADCGGDVARVRCSLVLSLCYETLYGYVWDAAANGGEGAWATPPSNVAGCGPDLVFWPLINGCYDPFSGYAWSPTTNEWVYVGDLYTAGPDEGIEPGPPPT